MKTEIAVLTSRDSAHQVGRHIQTAEKLSCGKASINVIRPGKLKTSKSTVVYSRNGCKVFEYNVAKTDPIDLGAALYVVAKYTIENDPSVLVNINKPQTLGFAVALVGSLFNVPTVVRMTGETFRQVGLARSWKDKLKVWLLHENLAAWAYSLADKIAPVGVNLKQRLVERGYEASKITAAPQPFDPQHFNKKRDQSTYNDLKEKLGLHPKKTTVLFVGRLSWLKGTDRLVGVIEQVLNRSEKHQFCIVGDGTYKKQLQRWSNKGVIIKGQQPQEKMPNYFHSCDVLIHTSRTDGLPNVVLEALSTGTPVIAYPVGEISEYVSNTFDGIEIIAEKILTRDWTKDRLGSYFTLDKQKKRYRKVLDSKIITE